MSKRKSVRDFLHKVQRNLSPGQSCRIRISDRDDYEHLSFTLREDTDLDQFNNVYVQQILDADVNKRFCWDDEDMGDTIFITADIEV